MRSRPALAAATLALMLVTALAGVPGGVLLARSANAGVTSTRPADPPARPHWLVTLTLRTVPPVAGAKFTFDGAPVVTNRNGAASVTEQHNFGPHTLTLVSTTLKRHHRRYHFTRWAGQRDPYQAFLPTVTGLPMRAGYAVTAGFTVACPVRPRFISQDGRTIDRREVSLVALRSNTGRRITMTPGSRTWLPCSRPVYRNSALISRTVTYSVQTVIVLGANVAHSGMQRFRPSRTVSPRLVGYFYDLTITAHDALFGGATGTGAVLALPDGSVRRVRIGASHAVTLRDLPQGDYRVTVEDGSSTIGSETFRLSRDKTVDLTVESKSDLATVGGAVLAVVILLPLASGQRRRRLGRLVRGLRRRIGRSSAITGGRSSTGSTDTRATDSEEVPSP